MLSLAGNVFTRNVLGYSLFGAEELARFAFLWVIWLGVSLAVKRGAVTVITFVAAPGPAWWQRSVRTFSGLAWRRCWSTPAGARPSTRPARGAGRRRPALEISWFYPIVSMTVGYYFITLHYRPGRSRGRRGWSAADAGLRVAAGQALAGAAVIGRSSGGDVGAAGGGREPLIALGVIFVALTLAGTPIVFMLSIVGIIAFLPSFLGLEFFPVREPADALLDHPVDDGPVGRHRAAGDPDVPGRGRGDERQRHVGCA